LRELPSSVSLRGCWLKTTIQPAPPSRT